MLPDFTSDGFLPPGDYELTFDQLADSQLVTGNRTSPTWDESWRLHLVKNLAYLVSDLWEAGISEIFIDGSFVEEKDHPNDIDGYFVCDSADCLTGQLQRRLNLITNSNIWDWSKSSCKPYRGYIKPQLPMWHKHRVELYPHIGQLSGIKDQFGYAMEFPSAFRLSRSGVPRGIVKLVKEEERDDS